MKAAFLIRCSTKNQDLDRQTRDLTHLANLFYLIILYISFVYKKSFSLMLKQC